MLTSTRATKLKFGCYKFGKSILQFTDQNIFLGRVMWPSYWNHWPTWFIKKCPQHKFHFHIMSENLRIIYGNEESCFAHAQMFQILSVSVSKSFYWNFDGSFKNSNRQKAQGILLQFWGKNFYFKGISEDSISLESNLKAFHLMHEVWIISHSIQLSTEEYLLFGRQSFTQNVKVYLMKKMLP